MHNTLYSLVAALLLSLFPHADNRLIASSISQPNTISSTDYPSHAQMRSRLTTLSQAHPQLVKLESLARTAGEKDIWLLTIGRGDITRKPALAIVGGVEGDHLLGSELALRFAEQLLARASEPQINELLNHVSFYIFPDMSPDAREQYFLPLRYQRLGNANPTDLDRDGRIGEDGYDDLNNDGLITMMRVEDPTGNWMPHPHDPRVMVQARREKGERGQYLLLTEGIDNDKDGQFNEDGEEGVFFNRNFSFGYPAFTRGAGEHAVSETETRAIADFLFQARNVFAVVSFGPANNLSKPLTYNEREAGARIPTGWKETDIAINRHISHLYNQHLGSAAPEAAPGSGGDFFQWAYFHYGRYSFSTPGWQVPKGEKPEGDAPESAELSFLQWAEKNQLENVFVPWTPVNHPDFPNQRVEVGGVVPFAMKNPPYAMTDSIARKHTGFILELAALHPRVEIMEVQTERLARNLHRVTVRVHNTGTFSTASKTGEQLRWMQKTVLRLTPASGQEVVSGKTIEVLGALGGHSSVERSWIIRGNGTLTLQAGAEASGFAVTSISL